MTGIAYNTKLTKPITSVDQLLEDPELKGKVTMLDNFSDSLGIVMLANGDDPSKVTDDAFKSAIDRVKAASDSGQIRTIHGNDYTGPLVERRPQGLPRLVGRHRRSSRPTTRT